ncbi:MAG: A24 family peptidase [Noviherbaspirillum sp.]
MKTLFLLLCIAVFAYDSLFRRVPNRLLLLAIVVQSGLLLVLGHGLDGLTPLRSLAGLGVGMAVFLPVYMLGVMGAGDVKFFAALGLLLGATPLLPVWLIGTALAGAHALAIHLVREGESLPWLQYTTLRVWHSPLYQRLVDLRGTRAGIPYAAYLAIGAALVAG